MFVYFYRMQMVHRKFFLHDFDRYNKLLIFELCNEHIIFIFYFVAMFINKNTDSDPNPMKSRRLMYTQRLLGKFLLYKFIVRYRRVHRIHFKWNLNVIDHEYFTMNGDGLLY